MRNDSNPGRAQCRFTFVRDGPARARGRGSEGPRADVHGRKYGSELLPSHDGPGIMYGEFLFGGTGLFLRLVAGLMASAEIARNAPAAEAALDVSRELVACALPRMARRAHSTSALMTLAVVRDSPQRARSDDVNVPQEGTER